MAQPLQDDGSMNAPTGRVASFEVGRTLVVSLPGGSDLLGQIEGLVLANSIDFCRIEGIGSLSGARMTYYDQSALEDREIEVDRPMMLASVSGTALRSGEGVEVHCHLVLADALGMASAGDLSPGCVVFSCELLLQELNGPRMVRAIDASTGLSPLRSANASS